MADEIFVVGSDNIPKSDVTTLLSAHDSKKVTISGALVGILMCLQDGASIEPQAREGVKKEFSSAIQELIHADQQTLEHKRSLASLITYIEKTFATYPDELIMEYDVIQPFVYKKGDKSAYREYMHELFGESLPDDIQEGMSLLQDDSEEIEDSCYIICTPGEDEHELFALEFVFSLVYKNSEATNQELQVYHTCDSLQEAHDILLRMGWQDHGFEEILSVRYDERTEDELRHVFQDDHIRDKLGDKDETLVGLLMDFCDEQATQAHRDTILEAINKNRDRKQLLDIYVSENSVGRLTYFLREKHIGDNFYLNVFDIGDETESGSFSAYNLECQAFIDSLQAIIGPAFQTNCRGWKDIRFQFSGIVHSEQKIDITIEITDNKNKQFSDTFTLTAQQLIELIELVGSGEVSIYHAFDRESDSDDDGYDDD